jgi:hypothetical protein
MAVIGTFHGLIIGNEFPCVLVLYTIVLRMVLVLYTIVLVLGYRTSLLHNFIHHHANPIFEILWNKVVSWLLVDATS